MHRLRVLLGPLRVFDAVCRMGGVTRAAEVLHVTPSAVSHQLKLLEAAVGAPLFQKAGREIELTKTGNMLASRVADAFDRLENALVDAADPQFSNRLRLKLSPSLAIRWLVPRLPRFYEKHGDIDLEIATISGPGDLRLDGADCAIRHGVGEWTDVEFDHLFDDELVPVCSPAMAGNYRNARDLLQANLLHSMLRPEGWALWFASVGLGQESQHRSITLANAALCCQAAADGLGVAMVHRIFVIDDLTSGRLVMPVDHFAKTERGYYLVCDPMKASSPTVRLFREWIRSLV